MFFESSITTPFHFLNQSEMSRDPSRPIRGLRYTGINMDRAAAHMALYDVSYYVTVTEEATEAAREAGFEELFFSQPWTVFALPETPFVEVAIRQPVVYEDGEETFGDMALGWYDDIRFFDYWIAEDGPEEWPRVSDPGDRFDLGTPLPPTAANVRDVEVDDNRIAFATDAIGVPHLVKMTYFPNWKVTEGGDGPWRVTPSLMVVVPTEEQVVLQFEPTTVEYLGNFMTLAGLAVVGTWWWRRRRTTEDEQASVT